MTKHIVCYSGGVSSALVGAMVINEFGRENTIFLNHVVSAEPDDVARFEEEFAEFHGMEITEHTQFQTFWSQIKRKLKEIGAEYDEELFRAGLEESEAKPCECLV